MKSRSFSERFPEDHPGPKYGPLFRAVRRLARRGECYVVTIGYRGKGHPFCGMGSRPLGPTAIHLGREDAEGLLPGCGCAHDLADGYVSESTEREFTAFLEAEEIDLPTLGRQYIERVGESDLGLEH